MFMADSSRSESHAQAHAQRLSMRRVPLAALACALRGAGVRGVDALDLRQPRHRGSSDAAGYLERAQGLLSRGAQRVCAAPPAGRHSPSSK